MLTAVLDDLDDDALEAAYPWPEGSRWVRANMVMSLDGASVGPDGLSRSLSSAGDQRVFRSLRALADCVLVGAATIRAERYSAMRPPVAVQGRREQLGLAPAPVIAIVSGSLELPWEEPMFAGSVLRPLVVTGESADPGRLEVAAEHADVLTLPGRDLDVHAVVDALGGRGLRRIHCEGGARLLGQLVEQDLLDEADVTFAPVFAGTGVTPRTPVVSPPGRFELAHVIRSEAYLITRYVRPGR